LASKKISNDSAVEILWQHFDLIVAEGAGSLAEPNFRENDLVNMGLAHLLDADVYLVVDIDKGGAFANILGSLRILELVAPEDIRRIKGISPGQRIRFGI
jgi:adenosylcobyric acid synthase